MLYGRWRPYINGWPSKTMRIIWFAVITFLLSPSIGLAQFSFPYQCGTNGSKMLCLIDKHGKAQSVTLLSRNSNQICKAKTLESFEDQESALEPFPATRLETVSCPLDKYDIAFLGREAVVSTNLIMPKVTNAKNVTQIHSMIKKLRDYKQSVYAFNNNLAKRPVVYQLPSKLGKSYLAHYIATSGYHKTGPLFLVTNRVAKLIDTEASITRALFINSQPYLLIEHSCWGGCGDIYTALIRLEESHFQRIAINGYWAT